MDGSKMWLRLGRECGIEQNKVIHMAAVRMINRDVTDEGNVYIDLL